MKKTLSVLLSILMVVGTVSCCFGVTAAAADDVIAFRYDALGFTADVNGFAANIDFGKNIIRGFDVGVEGYGDYITAGKDGLYPLFETGSAIGTGDRVKVTTEQGNAGTAVADYETVVYGDLDGDGYLDVLDAVLVERISTGAYTPTESDFADGGMSYAAFVEAADVNCDGQINTLDYSALVDAALGGAKIDQRRVEASWVENVHSEIETQAFTGLEITPDFDVDLCGKLLDAASDYDVTFSENIEIGEAYITVSAKADSLYSGEKTFTFEIKSIIEIVCREIGTMLEECGADDCISVNYNTETSVVDVIFDGDALLALELNPDRDALTGVYSELMSLFSRIYAARKLTVGGVTVGENGVKNYAGINELKNELRNALRNFENAEENLVKSFDGVIASETVNENFKVNVKFNCSDADALYSGLAALDGFVAFGTDEAEPELTVIDVNIPVAYARELAAEYEDIYGAVEGFGAMDVNTFIGKFACLETADITAENGSVINMFTDAFGKMNVLVTDILAERDISVSADGSEYINANNGNAFNSENGSTADVGSFIAALSELADLESVNASAFSDGRGDYCVYVKVGYADSEYVKNYKLNLNVFGTLVDELENTACDYTALTVAINNANTVLGGSTVYTEVSLAVVNEKLAAANGVPAGLLKGVNCENQKLIDDTAQELNLAVAALINKADYTKLNEAKSAAEVIKADGKDYTDDTMAVLDNALSDANELSDDLSFEYQQTVNDAAKAINDAIAALKINADYTALNKAKEDAAEIKANGKVYTTATMSVLNSALTAAEGVPASLTIEDQRIIDDAAAALNTAIEGLKEKADYTTLNAAKSAAAKVDCETGNYTEESLTVFNTALANANAVSDDLSVDEQQTVNDAATALNDAIAALKINANYSVLNTAKADAAQIKANGKVYTNATMNVLDSALADAAEVPENLTSENQQLIDNAAAAVNNAIAALKEKANYTELDAAKSAAAAKKADGKTYTADSMAALDSALNTANGISGDLSVDDQQTVDNAAAAINNAIAALVEYVEPTDVNNIAIKFPNVDKFLYRVGNMNTVALSSLFEATGEVNSADVVLTVTNIEGNAAGAYTANTTAWQNGTVKFSGEGVVKVSISHNKAAATDLYLEVVSGKNTTTAANATSSNIVLLNDMSFSTLSVSNGYAMYGNGFTLKCTTDVSCSGFNSSCGFVTLNNGTLDNIRIECPVFAEALFQMSQAESFKDGSKFTMSRCAVEAIGNSTISNSYISGGRAAIFTGDNCNSLLVENSYIYGGTFCNINIYAGRSITLKNVTTVMEPQKVTADQNKEVIGLGIVVFNQNTKLILEGTLKQYNWISKTQASNFSSQFSTMVNQIFSLEEFKHTYNGTAYINGGIAYSADWDVPNIKDNMPAYLYDNRTDKGGYVGKDITVSGLGITYSAGAYSVGSGVPLTASEFDIPEFDGYKYNVAPPAFVYSNAINDIAKTNDTEPYCTYSNGVITVATTDASKTLDFSSVSIMKNGTEMNYTMSVNSDKAQINGKKVVLDTSVTDYTVTFAVTVNNTGYNTDGSVKDGNTAFTYDIDVHIAVIAYPKPVWSNVSSTGSNHVWSVGGTSVDPDYSEAIPIYNGLKIVYYDKTGQMHTDDLSNETAIPTIDGTNTFAVAELSNGCSIKISVAHSGYDYQLAGGKVYYYKTTLRNNQDSFSKAIKYTLTDPNGQTTESAVTVTYTFGADSPSTQIDNGSFKQGKIENYSGGGCFARGTLITLADGSQKKIEDITFGDKILAWDFFTGTYVEKEISLLVYHGDDTYAVANTVYSDGTVLRTIAEHGVFDYDLNRFVYITAANCTDYIGHRFVKYVSKDAYELVTMTDAYVTTEVTGSYSVSSAGTSNAIAEGLLTVAPPEDFYNWIEMDGKLHYNVEQFNADVEKYGLYDYEVFSDYVTYEQFVAFNGAYLKAAVEKGLFTFDYIIELINLYSQWMPE